MSIGIAILVVWILVVTFVLVYQFWKRTLAPQDLSDDEESNGEI